MIEIFFYNVLGVEYSEWSADKMVKFDLSKISLSVKYAIHFVRAFSSLCDKDYLRSVEEFEICQNIAELANKPKARSYYIFLLKSEALLMLGKMEAATISLEEGLKRLRADDSVTSKERGYVETYMARLGHSFEQLIFGDPARDIEVSMSGEGISKFILRRFPPIFDVR